MVLFSTLAACVPWVLGAFVSGKLSYKHCGSIASLFIAVGVGGAAGLFLFSFLLSVAAKYRVDIYPGLTGVLILGLLSTVLMIWLIILYRQAVLQTKARQAHLLGVIAMSVPCFLFGYVALNVPLQGWDALGHWAHQAVRVLEGVKDHQIAVEVNHRHPATLVFLYSWFAWCLDDAQINPVGLLYVLLMASYVCFLFGYALEVSGRMMIGLVTCYLAVSTPLIENHWLIGGYSDALVGMWVTIGAGLAVVGVRNRQSGICALGISALLLPMSIKNTGVLISAIAILALLVGVFLKPRYLVYSLTALLAAAAAAVIALHFSDNLVSNSPSLLLASDRTIQISFGGWRYEINFLNLQDVGPEIVRALLLNLSFSIIFVLILISSVTSTAGGIRIVLLIIVFVAAIPNLALISEFRFEYLLDGDVGYSRFGLWYALAVPLLLPLVIEAVYLPKFKLAQNSVKS